MSVIFDKLVPTFVWPVIHEQPKVIYRWHLIGVYVRSMFDRSIFVLILHLPTNIVIQTRKLKLQLEMLYQSKDKYIILV